MGEGKGSKGVTKHYFFKYSCKMTDENNLICSRNLSLECAVCKEKYYAIVWGKKIVSQRNERRFTCFHGANTDIIIPSATRWRCLCWSALVSWLSCTLLFLVLLVTSTMTPTREAIAGRLSGSREWTYALGLVNQDWVGPGKASLAFIGAATAESVAPLLASFAKQCCLLVL